MNFLGAGTTPTFPWDQSLHHTRGASIRRSLGRPRTIAGERLTAALNVAKSAPTLRSSARVRGLHLVAIDLDWNTGEGDEVRGPGEALLMAIAGRGDALTDLTGPGVPLLTDRL